MHTLRQYDYGEKEETGLFHLTRGLGLIPIAIILLLVFFTPQGFRPDYLLFLSLALGLEMLLHGARGLNGSAVGIGKAGQLLLSIRHLWYPGFLFTVQNLFLVLIMLVLYRHIHEMGSASSALVSVFFGILLVLAPLKRLTGLLINSRTSRRLQLFDEAFRALVVMMLAFMAAGITTDMLIPPDKPFVGELPPPVVIVWIFAVLIVTADVVLFIDRAFVHRHRPG